MTLSPQPTTAFTATDAASHRTAEENLDQHNLKTLFTQSLGWQALNEPAQALQQSPHQCLPVARKDGVRVWQVQIQADRFATAIGQEAYSALLAHQGPLRAASSKALGEALGETLDKAIDETLDETLEAGSPPLVIFVNADKTRSLWCQAPDFKSPYESVLHFSKQPFALWRFRLNRLAASGKGLFRASNSDIYRSFELLLDDLCEGISGISNVADRQSYAALTLQRTILIQAVQQQGWLDGDTWYLQTRFGRALQTRENFFEVCLRPLYQSLALPKVERPLPLSKAVGEVPFLGHLFHTHRIEQRYAEIRIEDSPFEEILGWLSEQASTDGLNPWMDGALGYCLEKQLAQRQEAFEQSAQRPLSNVGLTKLLGDRTLNKFIINQLNPTANASNAEPATDLNELLFNADASTCRRLTQEILPNLRILDPACGSGNLLVAIYQRLVDIFSLLIGYSQQSQDMQLSIWRSGLSEEPDTTKYARAQSNLLQAVQRRILKNNLHGIDISVEATESATFQLLLHAIATAQQVRDIEPLVDLSFNILCGNSLIGLIDVDEERFETLNKAGDRDILQGNLLQPLVADSYQTILAEKNLAIEHYKSRNQALADARNIPDYARAALLKEDILRLDIKAQDKLDRLLLYQMSQQLGVQYKAAQLAEKPQRRPLTLEDIDILQPFHWGYHFNPILKKGGFDIVVCAPPLGAFKPTPAEFLQKFRDLAEMKGVSVRSLKTSRQALSQGDPEIAQAWLFYQDQYAYVADYFYRSEQYAHQNPVVEGKPVRNQLSRERLFVEQCFNLLAPRGMSAVVLAEQLSNQPKAETLYEFLASKTQFHEVDSELGLDREAIALVWRKLV